MTWIFEDSGAILLEYYVDSSAKVVHYLNRSSPLLSAKATIGRKGILNYVGSIQISVRIYINHTSLVETAGRASLTYISKLAVLQLDAILQNARVSFVDKPKAGNKQQSKFERMLGMKYLCPGIGEVQLMVGVRKRDKTKIQYCITALTPIIKPNK